MAVELQGALTNATGIHIQSATHRVAAKFLAGSTSPITAVDLRLNIVGTVGSQQFVSEIQSDAGDQPSGTVLGAATAAWNPPAATGWTGSKALGAPTGDLVLNTPYWLVVRNVAGTPDATNYVRMQHANVQVVHADKLRHFNGTDWTTVAAVSNSPIIVLTHADGGVAGYAFNANPDLTSGVTDVFGTNRQGVRYRFGSQVSWRGVVFDAAKAGTPSDLEVALYDGSTQKAVGTVLQAQYTTAFRRGVVWFPATVIGAGHDCYVVFRQVGDAGTDANDFDLQGGTILDPAYAASLHATQHRFVHGTGNDPLLYTVNNLFLPYVYPLIDDPAVDYAQVFGGSRINYGIN
jgi:hypothetical protein